MNLNPAKPREPLGERNPFVGAPYGATKSVCQFFASVASPLRLLILFFFIPMVGCASPYASPYTATLEEEIITGAPTTRGTTLYIQHQDASIASPMVVDAQLGVADGELHVVFWARAEADPNLTCTYTYWYENGIEDNVASEGLSTMPTVKGLAVPVGVQWYRAPVYRVENDRSYNRLGKQNAAMFDNSTFSTNTVSTLISEAGESTLDVESLLDNAGFLDGATSDGVLDIDSDQPVTIVAANGECLCSNVVANLTLQLSPSKKGTPGLFSASTTTEAYGPELTVTTTEQGTTLTFALREELNRAKRALFTCDSIIGAIDGTDISHYAVPGKWKLFIFTFSWGGKPCHGVDRIYCHNWCIDADGTFSPYVGEAVYDFGYYKSVPWECARTKKMMQFFPVGSAFWAGCGYLTTPIMLYCKKASGTEVTDCVTLKTYGKKLIRGKLEKHHFQELYEGDKKEMIRRGIWE